MAEDADFTTHLAARVLNDNAIMTYRLLSRELKVHVNRAKEMLYTFHQNANSKKPGSCHATYLIAGYQPWPAEDSNGADASKDEEEDTVMMSSPFEASQATQVDDNMADKPGKMTIMVVAEEQLEAIKESFVQITSIHVYSVESAKLKDLVVLSSTSKEVIAKYADDAPEYRAKTYGTTFNPHAKKRPGKKLPTSAPNIHSSKYVVPVSKTDTVTHPPTVKKEVKETPVDKKDFFAGAKKKDTVKKEADGESSKVKEEAKKEATSSTAKTATAPRKGGQSNIMSSFGKAQPKKPKPEPAKEDTMDLDKPMFSEDEDDGDEDDGQEEEVVAAPSGRKTRKQKEEELKKMMEEEEEEEEEEKPKKTSQKHKRKSTESEDSIKREVEEDEATDSKGAASADETAVGTASAPESGPPKKRRGKRQVKKRITTKDEQGFLVTKHEMVWESFSEDEPEPPAAATAPKSSMPSSSSSSSKFGSQKGGAKKGAGGGVKSGNIMSFFGKK